MRVSEQVGEIRSMVLEREKSFGLLEADFEMIKDVFEDIKPDEFSKELNKKEQEIMGVSIRVEKLEAVLNRLTEEVGEFRKLLEKIKALKILSTSQGRSTKRFPESMKQRNIPRGWHQNPKAYLQS
jgi:hypothetical protein